MLKLFKNFSKKDIFIIILCVLLISLQVFLDLKVPDYMSSITRLIQSDNTKILSILKEGGWMLLCTFGSLVSAIFVGYLTSFLSSDFSFNIREKIFNSPFTCSFEFEDI